jgi:mono/diheme cytochrome c family protein
MNRMRWSLAIGLALIVAGNVLVVSCSSVQKTAATIAVDPVARGHYLVTIMGCNDCHTPGALYGAPDTTRTLSGSDLGWVGPWGDVRPRNLTPDSTGIGSWTKEQIVEAIRTGHTPDGSQLAPIMPWMGFSALTDEDAMAIASYLKSLPPIVHKNLDRVPPGGTPTGANMLFPPPPAWDAQNLPPPPAAEGAKK